jgi:uncharacterized membrane protein YjdF
MGNAIRKEHLILLAVNLALILGFGTLFVARRNYEFILYVGVIVVFLGLIAATRNRVAYTLETLMGLTVWSGLHLAGGGITVGDGRLYDVILIPISETYPILRYDQVVHIWGFGVATLVMYDLVRPILPRPWRHPIAVSIVLVMAGLGVGALNEIVEFSVTVIVPQSGVGGYLNTSLDLCSDLIGALITLVYLQVRYPPQQPGA